jgi:uncharacterized DUF497 family protein
MRIDWDLAKAARNATKHGVTFEEAMQIFRDPFARSVLDLDSTSREERWATIGETPGGHLLVVVHTCADIEPDRSEVRIISARSPTAGEAR